MKFYNDMLPKIMVQIAEKKNRATRLSIKPDVSDIPLPNGIKADQYIMRLSTVVAWSGYWFNDCLYDSLFMTPVKDTQLYVFKNHNQPLYVGCSIGGRGAVTRSLDHILNRSNGNHSLIDYLYTDPDRAMDLTISYFKLKFQPDTPLHMIEKFILKAEETLIKHYRPLINKQNNI